MSKFRLVPHQKSSMEDSKLGSVIPGCRGETSQDNSEKHNKSFWPRTLLKEERSRFIFANEIG
jgi:hypothetical protein